MRTAYKCRAYPGPAQAHVLNRTFGCVRVVWNRYPRFKPRQGRQCAEYTRSGFRWRDGALYLAKMDAPPAFTWSWPGIDPASVDPSTVTV